MNFNSQTIIGIAAVIVIKVFSFSLHNYSPAFFGPAILPFIGMIVMYVYKYFFIDIGRKAAILNYRIVVVTAEGALKQHYSFRNGMLICQFVPYIQPRSIWPSLSGTAITTPLTSFCKIHARSFRIYLPDTDEGSARAPMATNAASTADNSG